MKLMVVKDGSHLHWPESLAGSDNRYRGGTGYVVDMDAPREVAWCAGQAYKLRPAPDGAVASKIDFAPALRALKAEKEKPQAAAQAPVKSKPLPAVDAVRK
jgi:hypothetical protein